MNTFSSGGLNLVFDDIAGAGAGTVVLVHGFATSAEENWRRLGWYGAFERRGARVVALDLRGHGRSDKPHNSNAYGVEAMAADVVALMDHLHIGRADLMGYSLGARLAAAAAAAHPDRVANLILGGVGERLLEPREVEPGAMTMAQAMRGVRAIGDNGPPRSAASASSRTMRVRTVWPWPPARKALPHREPISRSTPFAHRRWSSPEAGTSWPVRRTRSPPSCRARRRSPCRAATTSAPSHTPCSRRRCSTFWTAGRSRPRSG